MKKRLSLLAASAIGIGIVVSYALVAKRYAGKVLEALMDSQPYAIGSEDRQEQFARHFDFPMPNPNMLQTPTYSLSHPFNTIINLYHSWQVNLGRAAIRRIASNELVGSRTGTVRPVKKGAVGQPAQVKPQTGAKSAWPSAVFCLPRQASAIYAACPAHNALDRLADFRQSLGLAPIRLDKPVLNRFELQQQFLREATAQLYAPSGPALHQAVARARASQEAPERSKASLGR